MNCFSTSCTARETLTTLNATMVMCEAPVRDRSELYRLVNTVLFALSTAAILGRFYSHFALGRLQLLDDGNMALILVCFVVKCLWRLTSSFTGLGQDMWKVPFKDIRLTLVYFWISVPFYGIEFGLGKIAFGLFYLRIFNDSGFRKLVWSIVIFTLLYTIAFAFLGIFICSPVSYFWWQWDLGGEHKGKCLNNNHIGFVTASFSIFTDLAMLGLPIPQVWALHLSTKKKVGVLFMFSIGFLVTLVSIIRLHALVNFAKSSNITYDFLDTSLWSLIEIYVGIICVCMPSLKLGLQFFYPKILRSVVSTSRYTSSGQTGGNIAIQKSVQVTIGSYSTKPKTEEQGSTVELVEI
ncbi:CFEM domain-containing protein, partial [Bipolaris maydis]